MGAHLMKKYLLNCFATKDQDSGNAAAVITEFDGNDAERQQLATSLNLPVSVFVSDAEAAVPTLRFFYPASEMSLCIHGALAAAKVISELRHQTGELHCVNRDGIKLIFNSSGLNGIQLKTSIQAHPRINISKSEICELLNITNKSEVAVGHPFCVASIGSPKLLVPITSLTTLLNLTPNFKMIASWSIQHNINGIYAYTSETTLPTSHFSARGFNPRTGHNEDAATGVAAGALALALKRDVIVEQGYAVGKSCVIEVAFHSDVDIRVGGAVIAHVN